MKNTIIGFFCLLLILTNLPASAVNYYVDPSSTGSSNLGTLSNPWRSLNDIPASVDFFKPGDSVFLKRGQQFFGTLSINCSGSSDAPIVYMPYGSGNAPVLEYNLSNPVEPRVADRTIIRLNQVNNIVIDGFELTDGTIPDWDHNVSAHVGYGVYIYKGPGDNGSHNIIRNCTISKLGAGVIIDVGRYNTIANCTIRNMRMVINTPDIAWDDFGAVGIVLGGSDNTITNNHIQDCWSNSFDYQYDGGAIEMYGPVSNNKILYNTAVDNLGFMECGSGTAGQAYNNLIGYNLLINNGHILWINMGNGFGLDVRNLQLYNNNIIQTKPPLIADVRNQIGIFTTASVSNVITMKNNIFWLTTPTNITDPNVQPFSGSQLIHQSNLYHMAGGSFGFTLDASERQLNQGESLFKNTSSFSDPSSWDFSLNVPSAAIDFGQNIGINKDFFGKGVPFGMTPDAGIAEYISLSALPLEMLSIKGWSSTSGNTVEWVTTTDTVDHFDIERSNEGVNFEKIAEVPYKMHTGSDKLTYQFIDNNVSNDIQYYRIKAVEPGNAISYSQVVSIKNSLLPNELVVWPNPVQDYLYLKIPGQNFRNKEMILYNMSGLEVRRVRIEGASAQVKLNVSSLPAGAYLIKILDHESGKHFTARFVK